MRALLADVRYAGRRIRMNPGFSAMVVITLGLGIGANSAIFSVVNGLLLRPLPYAEPDRLVEVNHHYPSLNGLEASISARGYRRYDTELRSFSELAVETGWGVNLTGDGEPERLNGVAVSASWFDVYGVAPALGRAFLPEEDQPGANRVVILSHGLWQRRFGGDPSIVGRLLTLNGEPHQVVGVLPQGTRPFFSREAEILRPVGLTEAQYGRSHTSEFLTATGRLAPGVTLEQAQGELARFGEQLKEEGVSAPADWSIKATPLNERARGDIRPALLVLLGAVGFVLLIACANVANLLLARAAARRREIAVRLAMGARARQLVRQLVTESLVLSLVGGGLGLALAAWAVKTMQGLSGRLLPSLEVVSLDATVVLFTALVAVATGLLFGTAPALQAVRTDVESTLREGARGGAGERAGQGLRRALVVTEFALALSLLVGAGLLVKSFARLSSVDPGFAPENLLTFNIALPASSFPSDTARAQQWETLIARLEALPGVRAVGATSVLPFSPGGSTGSFAVEGHQPAEGEPAPWGDIRVVNPDYVDAMRIPLLRGRFLEETDREGGRAVVVVDEEMVRRYWPDTDPLGKRISFDGEEWFDVVGVVGHAAHEGVDADPRLQLYFSYRASPPGSMWFALRTAGEPYGVAAAARQAVWSVDANQPLSNVATMEERMSETVGPRRLAAVLLGLFAGLALLLASMGVYGVMSYMVTQRTRELGVRMAMGAERGHLLRLVLGQGFALVGAGAAIGLVGALALTRLLESQLYGVTARDPGTFAIVTALLVAVAAAATLAPALRATRVDPVVALRRD